MTAPDLAAALIADVPLHDSHHDHGGWMHRTEVLAALSRALDGVDERAGEVLEALQTPAAPFAHYTKAVQYNLSVPVNLGRVADAADLITALLTANAARRAERDAAVEAKLDAIDTLNNWFDRRKLGHDAVDRAVVDAASGYLRTSRVGGMLQAESDLILGVVQDMARLGLFADLFARAALTTEEGHDG